MPDACSKNPHDQSSRVKKLGDFPLRGRNSTPWVPDSWLRSGSTSRASRPRGDPKKHSRTTVYESALSDPGSWTMLCYYCRTVYIVLLSYCYAIIVVVCLCICFFPGSWTTYPGITSLEKIGSRTFRGPPLVNRAINNKKKKIRKHHNNHNNE